MEVLFALPCGVYMQRVSKGQVSRWVLHSDGGHLPEMVSVSCPHCLTHSQFEFEYSQPSAYHYMWCGQSTCPACREEVYIFCIGVENDLERTEVVPKNIFLYPPGKGTRVPRSFSGGVPEELNEKYKKAIGRFNNQGHHAAFETCVDLVPQIVFKILREPPRESPTFESLLEKVHEDSELFNLVQVLQRVFDNQQSQNLFEGLSFEAAEVRASKMIDLIELLLEYFFVLPNKISELQADLDPEFDLDSI